MINEITQAASSAYSFFKIKTVGSLLFIVSGFFLPVIALQQELISLLVLLVFDFATGVYAASKTQTLIKSAGIFRTAVKIVIYFVLVSAAFHTENTIPLKIIDEAVIGFLAVTELISVLENTALAGHAIPRKLLTKLQNFSTKL